MTPLLPNPVPEAWLLWLIDERLTEPWSPGSKWRVKNMTAPTPTVRKTRDAVRRAGSNLADALGCRKIMAMVNPPKTSSVSFGRMNNEANSSHDHQPRTKATLTGENLRTSVGQHAKQEEHYRLFADVRGPKDQAWEEEDQVSVAPIADPAEREREGPVVARDSDE